MALSGQSEELRRGWAGNFVKNYCYKAEALVLLRDLREE